MKKVSIIGAGAVGCFYGSLLQKSGLHVEYQSRSGPEGERQVSIESVWGSFEQKQIFHHRSKTMSQAELIIITTKALPGINYNYILDPIVKTDSVIVLIQNGINIEEELAKLYPNCPIIGGVAFTCINRVSPHKIIHLDYGPVTLASLDDSGVAAAKKVEEIFTRAGIPVKSEDNLRRMRWIKLLWNIPFNPLSVILQSDTSTIIRSADILETIENLMDETIQIAASENIIIESGEAVEMIEKTKTMKPYKTSMLLDYENKNQLEVEAILGEPLKIAKNNNINTPVMRSVYNMLKFYNQKALTVE